MKTIYYLKRLTAIIAMLLTSMNVFSQTAPPVTTIGTISGALSTDTDIVSVNVTGFPTNVGNISLTMKYNPAELVYVSSTPNPGLPSSTTITNNTLTGTIVLSYIYDNSTLVQLNDPLLNITPETFTLFTVIFEAKPNAGNPLLTPIPNANGIKSLLTWSTDQNACLYSPPVGNFTPIADATNSTYFKNGSISILPDVSITANPLVAGMPTISGETTTIDFLTEAGMNSYDWIVSDNTVATVTDFVTGLATPLSNHIKVTYSTQTKQQWVSVNYVSPGGTATDATVQTVNYYPFAAKIDPTIIPKFIEGVPHFAAGLRVDAKAHPDLTIHAVEVKQVALPTGFTLPNGKTIGIGPDAGLGNYQGYAVSINGGRNYGPAMWPAQTIEAAQDTKVTVQYVNDLPTTATYSDFNILADQTLMMNGYPVNGDPLYEPYTGPIPMVVHLHGGEMPSNSDGGPTAWFMPTGYDGKDRPILGGTTAKGPGFAANASTLATYPNAQEGTTLWYHPHDQGLTRINVYCGLAGFYFLRGKYEDAMHLPGWSQDTKVLENPTPAGGRHPFPLSANPYKPEIELAVQDRMFNINGALYWPVTPTNPDVHPFWTPEFFGDVMTVNGKSWPYLSVAPRKYMFRLLNGCNARFLNLWLENVTNPGTNAPKITVVATEGGFLDHPVDISQDVNNLQTLFIAPAERPMIIIDFSQMAVGTKLTLRNDANAPYPGGTPADPATTGQIMQFIVDGTTVADDNSADLTTNTVLRPSLPLVKLTNFDGTTNVAPSKIRQLLLNEIATKDGPEMVAVNNSHFDGVTELVNGIYQFGGPTETPAEGTTELWQIINTTVDAHPMHIHLSQWQLVGRQKFDKAKYMAAYALAWQNSARPQNLPNGEVWPPINFPDGANYPGGAGSPNPYDVLNTDGAVGGNPAISSDFLIGPVIPARPEEMGWKDAIKALSGDPNTPDIGVVSTYICRLSPTDLPLNTPMDKLVYSFDPSTGPGYVWHCHIIDHEDMDMMRPLLITPNISRNPHITTQPVDKHVCILDNATFNASATSLDSPSNVIHYQWQFSPSGNPHWVDIDEATMQAYTTSKTATLNINTTVTGASSSQYRCILTNNDGTTISNEAQLIVTNCKINGTVKYNNSVQDILPGMKIRSNGGTPVDVQADGTYSIPNIRSGDQTITVDPTFPTGKYYVGSVNSTDAGLVNYWSTLPNTILRVKALAGDVNADGAISPADALAIQNYFVNNGTFTRSAWSFWNALTTITGNPIALPGGSCTISVNGNSVTLDLLGMVTGDFNGSLNPLALKSASTSVQLTYGESRNIGANQEIELPLRAVSSMEVGAISLILNIPSDLVEVKDVYMKGSNDKLSFKVTGNTLRIGWNSLTPVNMQASGDLVILKLKTTSSFTEGKTIKLKLDSNPLNEIANGNFKALSEAVLNTDALIGINDKPGSVGLSVYPNPFSENSTLSYTLPADANVTLQIYNLLGVVVKTLVNEHQPAGAYTTQLDANKMPQGTYTAILRINDNKKMVERIIKVVVNK